MVQVQVWSRNKDKKRERQREHKRGCKTTNTSQAKLALQPAQAASQPACRPVILYYRLYKWKYGKGIDGRGNGK